MSKTNTGEAGIWYGEQNRGRGIELLMTLSGSPGTSRRVGGRTGRSYEETLAELVGIRDGRPTAPLPREYVDIERERGRKITESLRKTGFTAAQKREIKERDGGCVGNGRYGECAATQPVELCQADHIDPDGPNAVRNGQLLCGNCHDWKTAIENGWWKP